jgi:uncharacterized membrane protein YozB (DUF420 family)
MNRTYIRKNITFVSIILFVAIYWGITYIKPGFLYNYDGSIRQFGLNSNKKTVIPIWLLSILLAIVVYLAVLYYLALPKLLY